MKTVLVTGGAGFIGSHTCINLIENNYRLIVVDSNINSSPKSIERIRQLFKNKSIDLSDLLNFFHGDIRDKNFLNQIFANAKKDKSPIEAVLHFAGLKSVEDSFKDPMLYWENNVVGSLTLFEVMQSFNCNTVVFSSSATVYGITSQKSVDESSVINPNNPYGQTKAAVENLLEGIFKSYSDKWRIANLRYFNPIGAHESGLIGEDPNDKPNNLFPIICRVAGGTYKNLKIFGRDWPTIDGTGVRDYIHVMDLADSHRCALDFLLNNQPQFLNLNIGTGKGTSVLELIQIFSDVNECDISYEFCERRPGDLPVVIANNRKAIELLNWCPKKNLYDMCLDGWNWQKLNPNGYK